jgi:hypothetical protein
VVTYSELVTWYCPAAMTISSPGAAVVAADLRAENVETFQTFAQAAGPASAKQVASSAIGGRWFPLPVIA